LKPLLYITLLLLFHLSATAQQYYIKGEIRDEAGQPLQNVSIVLHSTGYKYYSGSTGSFGIVTRHQIDTLTFTHHGYQKQVVAAKGQLVQVILKKLPSAKAGREFTLASFTKDLKRETQRQWFAGEETYASLIENGFISAQTHPTTDITLNVDRASYSNIRRFLNQENKVPHDAVRLEEMLNYFNQSYTEPDSGKTFGIKTALTGSPWNKDTRLLFATINSKKIDLDSLPPSHLVFLIDVSGSMDMPNRLPLLKLGFRGLVNNLRAKDSVSIVVYGGTVGVMLDATSGADKETIFKAIDSLEAGGSTPGESGVKLAYSVARNHFIKGGNNRVILATDGDFNVGLRSEADLEDLIVAQRQSGIYLTCLGVGMGNYKDSKIQVLAQKGNGNFAYIDSYAEAEKVLLKEFTQTLYTVAEDVYLNVKFNPQYVKEYRVLGFDNKVGALKDTASIVEGGEVGSAYSIQVVFEVVPAPEKLSDSLRRPVVLSLQYQLPNDTTRYTEVAEPELYYQPLLQAPAEQRFAAAVMLFGSILRESAFVKDIDWNYLLQLATGAIDPEDKSQKEFVTLVQQARTIYQKGKRIRLRNSER